MARTVGSTGIRPNSISVLSVLFAALAMAAYLLAPDMATSSSCALCWLAAAACIQLRLLCNLLDGMVAVEGGRASPTGPLFNEAPDRLADVFILVGAGYSTHVEPGVIKLFDSLPLGWTCAVLAMGTAYIRLLQGTLTGEQSFIGPMAKQHRMAVMTGGTLLAAAEQMLRSSHPADEHVSGIWLALVVIALGSTFTCIRRLRLITSALDRPQEQPH
jgi:phosphatidylglycerophosphate synthase